MTRRYIATKDTLKLLTTDRSWIKDGSIILDFDIAEMAEINNVDASAIIATLHEIEPEYPCVYLDIDGIHNDPQADPQYCGDTMTVGELIKALKDLGEDSLVFFRREGEYTHAYGSIQLTDINEGWTTDEE